MIEQDDAVLVLHRHQRLVERTVGPRPRRFLLRVQGVGIDVLTAEAFKGGDQVGAHPWGVKWPCRLVCGSSAQAPPSLPIGTA